MKMARFLFPVFAAILFLMIILWGHRYGANVEGLKKTEVSVAGNVFYADVAATPFKQAKGLSGREKLGDSEAMLFVFRKPSLRVFWMRGMKIPIDIVWIRENVVIGIVGNVLPEPGISYLKLKRYSSPSAADMVLEVAAGVAKKMNINVDDSVSVKPGK
jgi:hypothetical protein